MPRTAKKLTKEQEFLLDTASARLDAARRGVDQGRRELGTVMRVVGLSASARYFKRSREWARQIAQEAEDQPATTESESAGEDLAESIRRLGVVEPISLELVDDETLRLVDGHRRLRAAREAGITSLPVTVNLATGDRRDERRAPAEQAAREHRRVVFRYARPDGIEAERTVDVWGVVHRADRSYLIGFDQAREAPRTFRLSRIVGDITFIGEGMAPPDDFSPEASVWGPLDPESLEALEESFRRVLKAERSSPEDAETSDADAAARVRLDDGSEDIRRSLRDLLDRMGSEVNEIIRTVKSSEELLKMEIERSEGHPRSLDDARS